MRSFIVGEGSLAIQCAEILLSRGHEVCGFVTAEPSIEQWASSKGIPHLDPRADVLAFLQEKPFDFLFSIVNLSLLKTELTHLPLRFAVNFHDGYLPRYAGLHATSWALLNRERTHGVTWHEMTAEADTGRILRQRAFDIAPDETAFTLNAKCYTAGIESFLELVQDEEAGTLTPVEQDLARRTYFEMYDRPPFACTIDWDADAEEVRALVAALDFGAYSNPMGSAKALIGGEAILLPEVEVEDTPSTSEPGTLVEVGPDHLRVATRNRDLTFRRVLTADGEPLAIADLAARHGLAPGVRLSGPDAALRDRLTELADPAYRAEPFWIHQLQGFSPASVPFAGGGRGPVPPATPQDVPAAFRSLMGTQGFDVGAALSAAVAAFLGRLGGDYQFHLGYSEPLLRDRVRGLDAVFAEQVPLRVDIVPSLPFGAAVTAVKGVLDAVRRKGPYLRDLLFREPLVRALPRHHGQPAYGVAVDFVAKVEEAAPRASQLTFAFKHDGSAFRLVPNPSLHEVPAVADLGRRFATFLERLASDGEKNLRHLSLLTAEEERRILGEWNDTAVDFPADALVHEQFAAQVLATPDAAAVVCRGSQLTYRELDERSSVLARHLRGLGIGPDLLVGIFMERSVEMMVSVLGTLKAGGAYVPLDPQYPRDRLAFMIEDAGIAVLLTQEHMRPRVPGGHVVMVAVDRPLGEPGTALAQGSPTSRNLAYVIYTSGSTGRPKGVMVEHRNVVNFFTAMDAWLGTDRGTWLAVTSLNFDISVLELLYTLTRGYTVVIHAEEEMAVDAGRHAGRPMEMSLFYFSSDEGERATGKYELLLEGARFADEHGFCAVWTPERHFHAFGGLYPNPAVTSAALATITKRVGLRAGSCVSPLHSPLRIAEEWSVVDNISGGRVGISFASGWQPNDFALRPESFADRKNLMFEQIETVRRLWRGEALPFKSGTGKEVEIRILPRPYQPELPVWVTAAGNPETFEMAARTGANLLTHLLGQTVKEVAEKVALYRRVWAEAGHPGRGTITLMLHTFVGESDDAVKEVVREPMKEYLRSAVGLIKEAAWSFPTFKENTTLDDGSFSTDRLSREEMDALLNHAFERYHKTSGLFGSVASCVKAVDELKGIDVDEIACLIDFGVPSAQALAHLPLLADVLEQSNRHVRREGAATIEEVSIPALIERHRVTHLQCTPSMAGMLVVDERSRQALRSLRTMLVGGEALPVALARQLEGLVPEVLNMYGPTETTIWSSIHPVKAITDSVPIGRPIANTEMLILDTEGQLTPVGVLGELCIGGAGVVRGYLNREALTAERFVPHPFGGEGRLYRTGDLARFRPDGVIEFEGRLDLQVKLRGYRIELRGIETLLCEHPQVSDAVVIVREDVPGDKRLVAYLIPKDASAPDPAHLREHLRRKLPEYMVPAAFVALPAFPQTPNRKVDRKALPAPEQVQAPLSAAEHIAPTGGLEEQIAAIWRDVLRLPQVSVKDNFFDLGGHSLLTVQVLERLKKTVDAPLSLVDMFRFPSIRALAAHLRDATAPQEALQQSAKRGARRRAIQDRRRR